MLQIQIQQHYVCSEEASITTKKENIKLKEKKMKFQLSLLVLRTAAALLCSYQNLDNEYF